MVDYTESGVLTMASDLVFSGGREGHFSRSTRAPAISLEGEPGRKRRQRADYVRGRRPSVRGGVGRGRAVRVRAGE